MHPSNPAILLVVFFVQGLAFFAMSVSILVASRPHAMLTMARSMWLLAAFGFLHSATSWLELAQQLFRGDGLADFIAPLPTALLALHSAALAQFGANVVGDLAPQYRWVRSLPLVLFLWASIPALVLISSDGSLARGLVTAEAMVRYILYLPAALLSALAFYLQGRVPSFDRLANLRRDYRFAAVTFALYALGGGALVPTSILLSAQAEGGYAPSAIAQVPVQVVRLLLAPVVAWVVVRAMRIFELEHLLEVEELNQRLHRLSRAAVTAQEEERRRIALELHDDTAQLLSSLLVHLKMLRGMRSMDELGPRCTELMNLATEASSSIRGMANRLRPAALDDLGLVTALQWYAEGFAKRHGLRVEMKAAGLPGRIDPEIELAVYRIVQECLRNAARHARATTASIFLEIVDGRLRATVSDDGCGFDPVAVRRSENAGLGILGMSERAALVGGTLEVNSRPGCGTVVRVEVPLKTRQVE